MKKHFLLITLLIVAIAASAAVVSPERALQTAQEFVPNQVKVKKNAKGKTVVQPSEIVYTHYMPKSGRPAIYVVNVGNAFAIVSADDVAHPILGYNYNKAWPKDGNLPQQVQSFFDDLARQMEVTAAHLQDAETADEWRNPRKASKRAKANDNLPDSVGPLLTTTWDQGQFYNALCPEDGQHYSGHVLTGCVATAMAQMVNYWGQREPLHTRGTHSYKAGNYGDLSVSFDTVTYDFAHMTNALTSESTQEEVNAVAKLIYHCGVAVNMGYSVVESSALNQDTRAALVNFFQFSPDMSFVEKSYFETDEWAQLLRKDIAANRPVIYNGFHSETGAGHSFICDGYKSDDYFHFNYGWGGAFDGWFLLNAVNPNVGTDYNSNQSATIGIVPTTSTPVILGQTNGNSTFVVEDEPLEFYHTMGHNTYAGTYYSNPCTNNVLFVASDATKQLVLDIRSYEDQNVTILDGLGGYILRTLNAEEPVNDLSSVISADKLQLEYRGNLFYSGFHFLISQNSDCRMVSNIVSAMETTTVHLGWTENGQSTRWEVEYGPKGFARGTGTKSIFSTNTATFTNLSKLTEYDFYISPICSDDQYGPWNKLTVMVEAPYWHEVVTSQPEGYTYNPTLNAVEVSTAEGLAWWAKNYSNTYDLYLTADIDLGGYKWKPAAEMSDKSIYGQGHVISNGYIHEESENTALISCFMGQIHDLGLMHFNVTGAVSTAGLCGKIRTHTGQLEPDAAIIQNCYVINSTINGTDYVAGLVGINSAGTIENCFVNVEVIGRRWVGMLVGLSDLSVTRNCYAAGGLTMRGYCFNGGIGYAATGEVRNFYSVKTQMGVVAYKGSATIADTSLIQTTAAGFMLRTPIQFDGETVTDLLTALNRGVQSFNDSAYCTWVADVKQINGGFPVFGSKHVISCPNVSDVSLQNIRVHDTPAVLIRWTENGDATQWRIRYQQHDKPDEAYTYHTALHNSDTIYGLPLGTAYNFSVQAMCDADHKSGWSDAQAFIVDLPHWTDIVTTQPEGYKEDGEIIQISSPEGLAWLAVKVNGLNGQDRDTYADKTIVLTADIDLEGYRWTPIGLWTTDELEFSGILDGQNHIVSNIYVNERGYNLGLIGYARYATIKNIILRGGSVTSNDLTAFGIGGLAGYARDCKEITNCHSSVTVRGTVRVGALCGDVYDYESYNTIISNCSASGTVYGRMECGGLIGYANGDIVIRNCYATGDVKLTEGTTFSDFRGGLIGNLMGGCVENAYSTGIVSIEETSWCVGKVIGCPDTSKPICYIYGLNDVNPNMELVGYPCTISDTAQFRLNEDLLPLLTPVSINEVAYNDLLKVLNAWVNANNSENKYRQWAADSANVNGGYPVFAAIPKYLITFVNEDGTVLQSDSVTYGMMPVYTGAKPTKASTAEFTYTFAGWTPEVVVVTGDATYKATFNSEVNQYVITWLNEDESVIDTTHVAYGQVPTHEAVTKEATAEFTYTFAGWTPEIVAVTGDATYTATFSSEVNQYVITWLNEDESVIDTTHVAYGQVPTHEAVTKEATAEFTYTFAGWTPEVVAVTGDATYTATFNSEVNQYVITWLNEDESVIDTTHVAYGQVPTHEAVTKEATAEFTYTFAGWTPEVVAVTGDATYTATFSSEVNQYVITWLNEDESVIDTTHVAYGQVPTHEAVTKEATAEFTYTFAGWSPEIVAVTGDATYKATFNSEVNQYVITFLNDDNSVLSSQLWYYGEIPTCEQPTKEDDAEYTYAFAGWNPEIVAVTTDATYTATYTATKKSEAIEDVNANAVPHKVLRDGQIFILRGDKTYTITGQAVK